jgi:alkanesulfonate monooxygenase SsuD/methylene tetrahydromethanopterin reductase-like flavin-dependent oxidoreductase (luciferase family)
MKIGVQLNPQVSIDKPVPSLLPTLAEQVRIADATGFAAFSMGEHYNSPACSVCIKYRRWRGCAPR